LELRVSGDDTMSVTHSDYKAPSEADRQRLYRELESSYFGVQPQERGEVEHFRQWEAQSGNRFFPRLAAACEENEQRTANLA
jgi:hypothetical protein